jgi:RNA polymerase sigma factor (sigma-70 family)
VTNLTRLPSPAATHSFVCLGDGSIRSLRIGEEWALSEWADPDAVIAALYREHARALVGLARVFVDHRDAAEDIVQEAFIRMARSLDRIQDPARSGAYLRSIVLNLARDHNRRGLLSLRHRMPANDLDPAGVDETIATNDQHRRLIEAVRGLPRRQRDCVALRYLMELSVADIAATLEVSENSVKTHLKRGLARLRTVTDLADDDTEESR